MNSLPAEIEETIAIENVVTSSDLGCNLDLENLSLDLQKSQYNVEQFPGLIYRSDEPKVTILVFRSGKVVCTGSQSIDNTTEGLDAFLSQLDDLGVEYGDVDIDVQNIVGVANLGQALNLNAIAIGLGLECTEYEPEQFPGLIYRMEDAPTVALLFGSGKMVMTGGKHPDHVTEGVKQVYDDLKGLSLI